MAADRVYHIGTVSAGHAKCSELQRSPSVLNHNVTMTFSLTCEKRAGDLLRILTTSPQYNQAVRFAIEAGFAHRSANCGQLQVAALCKPSDLWATVVYTRDYPMIFSGGSLDVVKRVADLWKEGKAHNATFLPPETIFARTEVSSFAVLI